MSGAAGVPEAVRQFGVDTGPLAARQLRLAYREGAQASTQTPAAQVVQAALIWPSLV